MTLARLHDPVTVLGHVESRAMHDGSTLLTLPLCPSTNARMGTVMMGGHPRQILTKEARDYIRSVSDDLLVWKQLSKFETINRPFYLDLWFILPRTNCDAHNYGKVLFDALEAGEIVKNDKYILPRYEGVAYDSDTCAVMRLPKERCEK